MFFYFYAFLLVGCYCAFIIMPVLAMIGDAGMKKTDLRKYSKADLLELLIEQKKRTDELEKELSEVYEALNEKDLKIKKSGSLAEAAISLSGVFEAADKAAAQYIDNVKRVCLTKKQNLEKRERESRAEADRIIAKANKEAELIIKKAKMNEGKA